MGSLTNTEGAPAAAGAEAQEAAPATGVPGQSLRQRMVRGSIVSVAGFGIGQVLRLGGNLVLTRLLFPEAFGLMTLVWSIMTGLEMLSDIGISAAIVRHERGREQRFLDTAWSLGIVRGVILWILAVLGAWPASRFFHEPLLSSVLPVALTTVWINALASTKVHAQRRDLELGRLAVVELSAQAIGLAVMIPWAALDRSVWVLVGGAVAAAVGRTLLTHLALPGAHNRFRIDREDSRALYGFGRWILFGSALHFLAKQSDRVMLGRFTTTAVLGVYGQAAMLSDAILQVTFKLSREVLFPAMSQISRTRPEDTSRAFYNARARLDLMVQAPLGFLAGCAPWVIQILYDDRYAEAGWMLRLMCVAVGLHFIGDMCQSCLVAMNRLQFQVLPTGARALAVLAGYPIGWHLGGIQGLIWAGVISEVPALLVLWDGLRRERVLRVRRELLGLALLAGSFGIAWVPGKLLFP